MTLLNEKLKLILFNALAVGVAIILLSYSAYGWFSISKEVRAVDMNLNITAPNNLEISITGEDEGFAETVPVDLKEYVRSLTKDDVKKYNPLNDKFYLLPASSYDGLSIWKTDTCNYSTGTAICGTDGFDKVANKTDGLSINQGTVKYNTSTSSFEGYYIDVPLWLRTAGGENLDICLSAEKTIIEGDKVGIVRVAFLNATATDISYINTATDYLKSLVYAGTGAITNEVVTESVGDSDVSTCVPYKYINVPASNTANLTLCQVASFDTAYHPTKIVLRIWIEGQDGNCIASRLIDNRTFNINIGFKIREN